jgi:hypothetical protein
MTQATVFYILQVLPPPVKSSVLTEGRILFTDVVTSVIADEAQIEIGVYSLSDLYRKIRLLRSYIWICLMAAY